MLPLVDMHCHLLAGLDDGPQTDEEAIAMCRMAFEDGTQMIAATAHQNPRWSLVTPDRIRHAATKLAQQLREAGLPLATMPSAEVMIQPDIESAWRAGRLLTVGDRGKYLLIELPQGLYVELRDLVVRLVQAGIRPILAHPERQPELLHEYGLIEQLIEAGSLVQVSSGSITQPRSRQDARSLRSWFQRNVVHALGSDGHSLHRRRPLMAEAYKCIVRWAGRSVADRVASTNGMAILNGLPLRVPPPEPRRWRWLHKLW